ncbi:hypothetical protein P154DRAFT_573612 [Amniculicola lignicola CBS 123094]|uniref:Uncharacterized protein n=1 Tax=Amniculicola lignicola CBS 123094 TaxID=1392246 RepID=A0A6A5WRH7_9PLEO|nr:hypothetical protein P154DRAFT_573612 [Amniculicola lignicola CBS 123094]
MRWARVEGSRLTSEVHRPARTGTPKQSAVYGAPSQDSGRQYPRASSDDTGTAERTICQSTSLRPLNGMQPRSIEGTALARLVSNSSLLALQLSDAVGGERICGRQQRSAPPFTTSMPAILCALSHAQFHAAVTLDLQPDHDSMTKCEIHTTQTRHEGGRASLAYCRTESPGAAPTNQRPPLRTSAILAVNVHSSTPWPFSHNTLCASLFTIE